MQRKGLNDVTNHDCNNVMQACELVVRTGYSEIWLPALPVTQATTWQLITFSGSKPSARRNHIAAWSDTANGLYMQSGWAGGGGLRRSGRAGTGAS